MRIEIGQILKTSYDTGPFRVESIVRGCTCSHILDEIESIDHPLPSHIHMRLKDLSPGHNHGKDAWINYVDEETLQTYTAAGKFSGDKLILLENIQPVQASFI